MDLSKLNQNEKLAVYGAAASIVGPILASVGFFGIGVGWLTFILALAMLAIVFMPQISPQTTLPGSKGSLMLLVGGIAAVGSLLSLLASLAFFAAGFLFVIGWLLGVIGGLLMGWAGWQEFQAEGGNFQLGTPAQGSGTPAQGSGPTPSDTEEDRASEG